MIPLAYRKELLDWNLLYVFSFDIELDLTRQERVGRFSGGVRFNLFSRGDLSRVYNIGRESTIPGDGRPSIAGKVVSGGDEAFLREDDVGSCNIKLAIETDDKAIIQLSYRLVGYLGPGGSERVISGAGKDRYGTEDQPYEVPITTSPTFDTTDQRYAWLNDHQAIGFGRAQVVRSKFRRNTQDIYVLT